MVADSSAETAKKLKDLLKAVPEDRADAARLDELRRTFANLQSDLKVTSLEVGSARYKWKQFLMSSHRAFIKQLKERIIAGKKTALRTFFGVIASSPEISGNGKYSYVSVELLVHWIRAIIQLNDDHGFDDKGLVHMIQSEFLYPYRDVQYYTMIAIAETANSIYENDDNEESRSRLSERLVQLLMMIPIVKSQRELKESGKLLFPPPKGAEPDKADRDTESDSDDDDTSDDSDDESDERPSKKRSRRDDSMEQHAFKFQQASGHRRVWSNAWLAVLRLPLPPAALKQVLQFLPDSVLPNVPNPLRFADFFINAYNQRGGLVPVLALDGLFLLMTQHGLEYTNFYKQLYAIVTPAIFTVKYRIRFFRLLDKCLTRNDMLPAHIVAAFIKRSLRCSLSAPPAGTLFVLALCSNLLRKHPETACLIHRNEDDELLDGFNDETDNPEEANALQSSLWELHALERHYYPAVVTMAKAVGREEELKTPLHDIEEFIGLTYKGLIEQERKRKRKGQTPLTFVKPEGLFTKNDIFAGILEL